MEIWEEIYNRLLCLIVMINSEINYSCEFLSLIDTANKIFIISLCVCVCINILHRYYNNYCYFKLLEIMHI